MATNRRLMSCLVALLAAGSAFASENTRENTYRAAEVRAMELRQELGLSEQNTFRGIDIYEDEQGITHVRLDQLFNGLRVQGADSIFHVKTEGFRASSAEDFTTYFHKEINVNTTPVLSQSEAVALASQDMAVRSTYSVDPKVELIVLPLTEDVVKAECRNIPANELNAVDMETVVRGYRLVYQVILWTENEEDGIREMLYNIDAHTGEIVDKYDNLKTEKNTGKSQYSGEVEIDVTKSGSGSEMRDPERGSGGNCTYDLANGSENSANKGNLYTNSSSSWGDGKNYTGSNSTSANGQTAAVDAHYGMAASWDFYKNVIKRNGIDGNGTSSYSRVHAGKKWDNACWGASGCFCMTYGDGSRFTVLTSIDVVGHELSHGVCFKSCNLTYKGESGGLNEANSDIGGSMVEYYARGGGFKSKSDKVPETGGNFDIGEQLSSKPLRWMHKPSKDGKSPDEWSSKIASLDVHYNSGPGNRMFYFLSQGAEKSGEKSSSKLPEGMKGIGNDKATRIWYKAMFTQFNASTNYARAREGCIKCAESLYGRDSEALAAVKDAFKAINVGK